MLIAGVSILGFFFALNSSFNNEGSEVFSAIGFGPDKNTLVYKLCPPFKRGYHCRIATYNIKTKEAFRFEPKTFPQPWWSGPSFSWDGNFIALTETSHFGKTPAERTTKDKIAILSLETKTYRVLPGNRAKQTRPIFSSDRKKMYSVAQMPRQPSANSSDDQRRRRNRYGILETDIESNSERWISPTSSPKPNYPFRFKYDGRFLVWAGYDGKFKNLIFSECPNCKKNEIRKVYYDPTLDEYFSKNEGYDTDIRFKSISRKGHLLFSKGASGGNKCSGMNFNLFISDAQRVTRKVTNLGCGNFEFSVDISPDGSRVLYRTLAKRPPNEGRFLALLNEGRYLDLLNMLNPGAQRKKIFKGSQLFLIEADGSNPRLLNLPMKFSDYTPIEVYPETSQ